MPAVLPPELLFIICAHVYAAGLPPFTSSLDPIALRDYGAPTGLPSSMPPGNCPEPVVRRTLANLCLVSHAWHGAAMPWLWQKIEVHLPRSWLALLKEITGGEEEGTETNTALAIRQSIHAVTTAALASTTLPGAPTDGDALAKWKESILESLSGPDRSIPLGLLSPPAPRDPGPQRLRSKRKSIARWKIMRTICDAVQNVIERNEPGVYGKFPYLFSEQLHAH